MKKEIVLSQYCDFCNGVKRTINICKRELDKQKKIYSIGQIIHNPLVIKKMEKKGLEVVEDVSEIPSGESLLIRSHGISPVITEKAKERNIELIDAACPFVKNIQKICANLKEKEYFIIITGDAEHPEVKALEGIAGKDSLVISFPEEEISLPEKIKKIGIVTQSTYEKSKFYEITNRVINQDKREVRTFNTICQDSLSRREEVQKIASSVDLSIVIGGRNSSNTTRLYKISKEYNNHSFHIEDPKHLPPSLIKEIGKSQKIGVIGGASTPRWSIDGFLQQIK